MAEEHTVHTTTTTTTTTQRSEISVGINVGFLRTPIGILMILEIFFGLLAWALLVSAIGGRPGGALGFASFGFIFTWVFTLVLFITFVFGLHGSLCANLPWGIIQVALNIIFVLLFFISSCCVAAFAKYSGNLSASTAFGFIVTVLYIISLLLVFRKIYGRFPWQTSTGAPAST